MRTLLRSRNLLLLLMLCIMPLAMPGTSFGQIGVGISIHVGPPALPVYTTAVPTRRISLDAGLLGLRT